MRSKLLFVFILMLIQMFCYSEYEFVKIKELKIGNEEGEVIYFKPKIGGGISPESFVIDDHDRLYIGTLSANPETHKINIYNLNIDFISVIISEEYKYIGGSSKLLFDNSDKIIGVASDLGLAKIDRQGKLYFRIKDRQFHKLTKYPENIFIFGDYILYYDKKNEPQLIDNNGVTISQEERDKVIKEETEKNPGTIRKETGLADKIDDFLQSEHVILAGDRLLTTNEYLFDKLFSLIKTNLKNKSLDYSKSIPSHGFYRNFIGFDKYDNSYWQVVEENDGFSSEDDEYHIVVYSKYGEVLDYFYNPIGAHPHAVAPNGDVYIMERKDGVTIYKVDAVWNKEFE